MSNHTVHGFTGVGLAGTWECGNCGATGDGWVEAGEVFENDHECEAE